MKPTPALREAWQEHPDWRRRYYLERRNRQIMQQALNYIANAGPEQLDHLIAFLKDELGKRRNPAQGE